MYCWQGKPHSRLGFQSTWSCLEFSWRLSELFGHAEEKAGRKSHENRLSSQFRSTSFPGAVWRNSKHRASTSIPSWPLSSPSYQVGIEKAMEVEKIHMLSALNLLWRKGFPSGIETNPEGVRSSIPVLSVHFSQPEAFKRHRYPLTTISSVPQAFWTKQETGFFFQLFIYKFICEH